MQGQTCSRTHRHWGRHTALHTHTALALHTAHYTLLHERGRTADNRACDVDTYIPLTEEVGLFPKLHARILVLQRLHQLIVRWPLRCLLQGVSKITHMCTCIATFPSHVLMNVR